MRPSASKYSIYRPETPGIDRADLLIMWNKIKKKMLRKALMILLKLRYAARLLKMKVSLWQKEKAMMS